jgi:hypothetical protein
VQHAFFTFVSSFITPPLVFVVYTPFGAAQAWKGS